MGPVQSQGCLKVEEPEEPQEYVTVEDRHGQVPCCCGEGGRAVTTGRQTDNGKGTECSPVDTRLAQ